MASQSHGYDNTVVGGTEATYASPASNYNWLGIVESFEPEESNNIDSRMSVGVRAPFMLRRGGQEVDGSISLALQNARMLAYALGRATTTGDGTAGYTHNIRTIVAGEELPSVTIQNHNPLHSLTRNYVGGKVDSLTITASAEEAVMLEGEFLFSHVEDEGITPAVVQADLENYFMFYEGMVKINNQDEIDVTEFEVEIGNGLERRFTLRGDGKTRPTRIEEGNLEITASITMDFTNKGQWEAFKAGDNLEMQLILVDSQDSNHKITISLTGGLYDTNSLAVGAEDLQEQELEAIFTGVSVVAVDGNETLI
jgi:uncharacterized protein YaiE (UPF0345 family)